MKKYLLGEEIDLRIDGLIPKTMYTLRLKKNAGNKILSSWASFYSDSEGVISTVKSYGLTGSYRGIDSAGLFWSLKPGNDDFQFEKNYRDLHGLHQLTVEIQGQIIKTEYFIQQSTTPDIECLEIHESINGFLYKHRQATSNILFLHGSGGIDQDIKQMANLLAVQGNNVFLLKYCENQILEEIPLEYFKDAMDWISQNLEPFGKGIKLVGLSKGGEAALLLASVFPESISLVCTFNSLTAPFQGINRLKPPHMDQRSSWTFKGTPLDFVPGNFDLPMEISTGEKMDIFPFYYEIFRDKAGVFDKIIDLKDFKGEVYLFSSEDDRLCPSFQYAELFKQKNARARVSHINWRGAGHVLGWPGFQEVYLFDQSPFLIGGTLRANGLAAKESWNTLIEILKK